MKHPVVGSLFHYKWKRFGIIGYVVNLLTYAVFLSLLTAFALLVPNPQSPQCKRCMYSHVIVMQQRYYEMPVYIYIYNYIRCPHVYIGGFKWDFRPDFFDHNTVKYDVLGGIMEGDYI